MLFLTMSFLLAVVDINTASEKELMSLKGIGVSKSRAIVNYRKNHCFKIIEEFSLVKGIGKKTLAKNRTNLSVGKCKK